MCCFVIEATILTFCSKRDIFFTLRIALTPLDKQHLWSLCQLQFPLQLCFVMSINKSQCQTLTQTGLHLGQPFFLQSKLYVGCSRVRCKRNLFVFAPKNKMPKSSTVRYCRPSNTQYFPAELVYGDWLLLSFFQNYLFFLSFFFYSVRYSFLISWQMSWGSA